MDKKVKLYQGDNIESLKKIPSNSVDSFVSDPPYGLSFMGKKWDYDVPSVEFWSEVYRVLKPGGHVLSFGGTRTYHRMVVNIEDAGFEIRDQIQWIYGSGFPKSHNIGKAVDKLQGNDREVVGEVKQHNIKGDKLNYTTIYDKPEYDNIEITKGQSPYEGWGTALKPANEPICVARKPLSEKSVAENVLKWGTGGINIDGCRVGNEGGTKTIVSDDKREMPDNLIQPLSNGLRKNKYHIEESNEGRFPANIILDEIAGEILDEQSGVSSGTKRTNFKKNNTIWQEKQDEGDTMIGGFNDKGGASRFFYQAKVSKAERNMGLEHFDEKKVCQGGYDTDWSSDKEGDIGINKVKMYKNNHPTVKPVNLMAYLCRLVTPPGGIILDAFMGSGSTGIAARLGDFKFIGMELDNEYFEIASARIADYENYRKFIK